MPIQIVKSSSFKKIMEFFNSSAPLVTRHLVMRGTGKEISRCHSDVIKRRDIYTLITTTINWNKSSETLLTAKQSLGIFLVHDSKTQQLNFSIYATQLMNFEAYNVHFNISSPKTLKV
jgi:hypothetical protein